MNYKKTNNIPQKPNKSVPFSRLGEGTGLRLTSFTNKEVFQNIEAVIAKIEYLSCSLLRGERRNDCKK